MCIKCDLKQGDMRDRNVSNVPDKVMRDMF